MIQQPKIYDLEERLVNLAQSVIFLVRTIKITPINKRIIEQLVAASGSAGANYCEANQSESPKDFVHKVAITRKELNETKHWLRLLLASNPEKKVELVKYIQETQELILIFNKISRTTKFRLNSV